MVQIVRQNYRENARLFQRIKRQLQETLGGKVAIEHVGSTAIKGMLGKNIVDVLVGVPENTEIENTAKKIDQMGYFRGETHSVGDYIFFASRAAETGSGDVHIHLVAKASERFKDFLTLKHYLAENPSAAKEYSNRKQKIADEADHDRKQYKVVKAKYVDELMNKAREYEG